MGEETRLFRSFVTKKGLRNTPEREKILEEIFASPEHFDVDELYMSLHRKRSKVSKASIYRNIPLIMECGLIREAWHEDGHMHYEAVRGQDHHCHLRCVKCGKVIEFVAEDLKETEKRLSEAYRFKIIDRRLDFTGYCSDCSNILT